MAYDATLAMIEAIKQQNSPTQKGTIKQLSTEDFSVSSNTATGEIFFNTPQNGDRVDFAFTLVRLIECQGSNQFVDISLDKTKAFDLTCQQ